MLKQDYQKLKKQILEFLPKKIIDSHVHTAIRAEKITQREEKLALPYSWLKNKTILNADSRIFKKIYPKSDLKIIGIPLPFDVMDPLIYNNELAVKEIQKGIPCELWGINNIKELEKSIKKAKFCGIKFHPKRIKKEKILITDMIQEQTFEFIEKHNLPITLEISHGFIKQDVDTLKRLDQTYNFKIILPHMAYNHKGFKTPYKEYKKSLKGPIEEFEKEFSKIKNTDNIYLDTSMIIDRRIIQSAINILGQNKILFGTDFPFGFTPKILEYRPKARIYAPEIKKILDNKPDNNSWKYYYNIYLQIQAIMIAENNLNLDIKNNIMNNNAEKVFNVL